MWYQVFFKKSVIAGVFLFVLAQVAMIGYEAPAAEAAATTTLSQINMFEGIGRAGTRSDPREIVRIIINIAMGFLGMGAVLVILFAGFKWMTAAGNKEHAEIAQKLLVNGVIGLIIIFSAWTVSQFVLFALKKAVKE